MTIRNAKVSDAPRWERLPVTGLPLPVAAAQSARLRLCRTPAAACKLCRGVKIRWMKMASLADSFLIE
uniref:Uncharacterized protein n=1 Tax=Leersia perrieri TaxID=77586 RepID=A0A0D9XYT7_9ORYZ